ncbi:retropepsin-like aspartic protease family protein [Nitratireductor basaltis]|uniref:Peptidase A2 domain-containing protein n=1 Tax=Nitratireductor basaltis TaxID=472175 RepID=A0A084UAY8_9HYPH|nr:TIGR02281 family clan AA aspartic protease [Nitratireductor basaltis]KFB10124.1 hypothetical protein EL18_01154 [Nitratireductor basaltis]
MRSFWIILLVLGAGLVLLVANHDAGSVFGIENSNFASLLYLGTWGAVLVVGLVVSRFSFWPALRDLAYWLLIALVLMTGYLYRYELQDLAHRFTAGIVPGSPVTIGNATAPAVMLEKGRNGHFEVRLSVNGQPVTALLDTGASSTVLTSQDAARVGIEIERLSFNIPIQTANGIGRAARARVEEIAVGPIKRTDRAVYVAPQGALGQTLLGMDFLSSLAGYDVRGDRLILRE